MYTWVEVDDININFIMLIVSLPASWQPAKCFLLHSNVLYGNIKQIVFDFSLLMILSYRLTCQRKTLCTGHELNNINYTVYDVDALYMKK